MHRYRLYIAGLIIFTLFAACKKDDDKKTTNTTTTFGVFKVQDDKKTVVMNGEITSSSFDNFKKLIAQYPDITQINIKECGGSNDDNTNLKLSHYVYGRGINIHLMDNGMIASGGVDFFIAGVKRTKGKNIRIGVHSWGGEDDSGKTVTATDFPVGHKHHLPYISYYKSVGFTQKEAEDFYYFTINAAPFNSIHWMTEAEITKYKLVR
jgi:hypothetical protein